jgi:hypothetical protein
MPAKNDSTKQRVGLLEQAVVTIKILLMLGAVLAGIWLLDTAVH